MGTSFIERVADENKISERAIHTLAVLSLLLVTKYVRSGESWRSVTTSMCARSLFRTSSPVLASKRATLPDSWPVKMRVGEANAQTTALLPVGLKNDSGSFDSATAEDPC